MLSKSLCIFHGVYVEPRSAILQAAVLSNGRYFYTEGIANIHHFWLPDICECIQPLCNIKWLYEHIVHINVKINEDNDNGSDYHANHANINNDKVLLFTAV